MASMAVRRPGRRAAFLISGVFLAIGPALDWTIRLLSSPALVADATQSVELPGCVGSRRLFRLRFDSARGFLFPNDENGRSLEYWGSRDLALAGHVDYFVPVKLTGVSPSLREAEGWTIRASSATVTRGMEATGGLLSYELSNENSATSFTVDLPPPLGRYVVGALAMEGNERLILPFMDTYFRDSADTSYAAAGYFDLNCPNAFSVDDSSLKQETLGLGEGSGH